MVFSAFRALFVFVASAVGRGFDRFAAGLTIKVMPVMQRVVDVDSLRVDGCCEANEDLVLVALVADVERGGDK